MRHFSTIRIPTGSQWKHNDTEIIDMERAACEIITSGRWAYGKWNKVFEKRLKEYLGIRHVSLVNSGSSANYLAISLLRSKKFNELEKQRNADKRYIVTTALSFPTTISPIIKHGYIPIFLDVSLATLNVDIEQVRSVLKTYGNNIRAFVFTNTLGFPFDTPRLKEIIPENIPVIEDNCDALGASYYVGGNLIKTGTAWTLGTSSFYPAHHISTGEGGAVYTNNAQIKLIIESLRDWGRDCWCDPGVDNTCNKRFEWNFEGLPEGYDHKYIYTELGSNLKMPHFSAMLGTFQMHNIEEIVLGRIQVYQRLLTSLVEFGKFLRFQFEGRDTVASPFGFAIIRNPDRNDFSMFELQKHLEENGIATRKLFAGNIIRQPAFKDVMFMHYPLNNTDYLMNNAFWIGVSGLSSDDCNFVYDTVKLFFQEKNLL